MATVGPGRHRSLRIGESTPGGRETGATRDDPRVARTTPVDVKVNVKTSGLEGQRDGRLAGPPYLTGVFG